MPTGTISDTLAHSYLAPRFAEAHVHDAMRMGVIACLPDAPLREVAATMATHRIHSVLVRAGEDSPWGLISDLDLAAAAGANAAERPAREAARTEFLTVAADETLVRAAQLMAEHETAHLVVVEPRAGRPVAMLSALDVAGVLAFGGR